MRNYLIALVLAFSACTADAPTQSDFDSTSPYDGESADLGVKKQAASIPPPANMYPTVFLSTPAGQWGTMNTGLQLVVNGGTSPGSQSVYNAWAYWQAYRTQSYAACTKTSTTMAYCALIGGGNAFVSCPATMRMGLGFGNGGLVANGPSAPPTPLANWISSQYQWQAAYTSTPANLNVTILPDGKRQIVCDYAAPWVGLIAQ